MLAAGCGPFPDAYTGPFRSPHEVAIITGTGSLVGAGYEDVLINSIDGERAIGNWEAPSQEVHVLPRTHKIGVVQAAVARQAASGDVFADQEVLSIKTIVGARYAVGYNAAKKEFLVVRVGLGPVPFKIVK